MKIEQWVEDRYNWLNRNRSGDSEKYDNRAYVWMDKAIDLVKQSYPLFAEELEVMDTKSPWVIRKNGKKLVDLNYIIRCFVASVNEAREWLRKLIVWCAVYNEVA
jgi:hypothetical protein